mmetsp:Transcript_124059/g.215100  ORF Transcript_124059/g.215100 Transcript_124059/m.215100 type:complete len:213 (+) Transcript_124059:652-1290(+)
MNGQVLAGQVLLKLGDLLQQVLVQPQVGPRAGLEGAGFVVEEGLAYVRQPVIMFGHPGDRVLRVVLDVDDFVGAALQPERGHVRVGQGPADGRGDEARNLLPRGRRLVGREELVLKDNPVGTAGKQREIVKLVGMEPVLTFLPCKGGDDQRPVQAVGDVHGAEQGDQLVVVLTVGGVQKVIALYGVGRTRSVGQHLSGGNRLLQVLFDVHGR